MTDVLPIGYVTIVQAAEMLQPSMFGGIPDREAVTRVRQMGIPVRDGLATNLAIAEIWKAVDSGNLEVMALGGRPPQTVRLDPAITMQIPALRSPKGRGFTLVRPSNPAFHELRDWFGPYLSNVTLVFQEMEIRRLASRLRRARRRTSGSEAKGKRLGRPSLQAAVQSIIREIVENGKWNALAGIKALTRLVSRRGDLLVSEDTVARALDQLHVYTQDRRYARAQRKRRAASARR